MKISLLTMISPEIKAMFIALSCKPKVFSFQLYKYSYELTIKERNNNNHFFSAKVTVLGLLPVCELPVELVVPTMVRFA